YFILHDLRIAQILSNRYPGAVDMQTPRIYFLRADKPMQVDVFQAYFRKHERGHLRGRFFAPIKLPAAYRRSILQSREYHPLFSGGDPESSKVHKVQAVSRLSTKPRYVDVDRPCMVKPQCVKLRQRVDQDIARRKVHPLEGNFRHRGVLLFGETEV